MIRVAKSTKRKPNLRNIHNPKNPAKVVILGAGLVGRMLAVSLSAKQAGFKVTLIDQDNGSANQSAAYLAAAMLAPVSESVEASAAIMKMGKHALGLWPEFINKLAEPVFFQKQGTVAIAHHADLQHLHDFKRLLKDQTAESIQSLNAQALKQLEPAFENPARVFNHALFLPEEGQLDNRQLLASMAKTLEQNGVDWQLNHCLDFGAQPELMQQLQKDFDWVIDCRGLGAKADIIAPDKLRGVRGEVLRVFAPEVDLKRPIRLMHPRYPIYIAPKENHQFVIGATQIESEDSRQPTVRSCLELLSSCFSIHPGFAEAEVLELKSGLRPTLSNNEPKIWQNNNLIRVNGLFRHGYLLAPTMVEQCLALIEKAPVQPPFYKELVATQTQQPNLKECQYG